MQSQHLEVTVRSSGLSRRLKGARDENWRTGARGALLDAINALLDEHIGHVQARIEELRELKAQLKMLRAQCQGEPSSADCGILQQLSCMSIHHPVLQTHLG